MEVAEYLISFHHSSYELMSNVINCSFHDLLRCLVGDRVGNW